MQIRAFSLIELLIVIVLIGFISSLVLKLNTPSKKISITDLREFIKDGEFIIKNNKEFIYKGLKQKEVFIPIHNPEVYVFKNTRLIKKEYKDDIQFRYKVKNGIGESFILKCKEGVFLFKPLFIKKVASLSEAKREFMIYQPIRGNYY